MRVFLAFSFRDEDKLLVQRAQQLLESLSTQVVTGERLGGKQLTQAVKARIEDADARSSASSRVATSSRRAAPGPLTNG